MATAAIVAWLAEAGLRNLPLEDLVDGFLCRLDEAGLGAPRAFVGMNTLHPLVRARSLVWRRGTGTAIRYEFQHRDFDTPVIRQSPFVTMIERGQPESRHDLSAPPAADEIPVFAELRDQGMTDWLGFVLPFGERAPQVVNPSSAERIGELFLVCSFSTDRPGGFAVEQVAALRQLVPWFALAAKATTQRDIFEGLLAAYLGRDPARRVLAGTVQRGEGQVVEAVLLFADLRGFTALADTLPSADLIAVLDDCLACMVRPVVAHGGEVLKFMGDGLLAAFAGAGPASCNAALDAAQSVLEGIAGLTAMRGARPTPALDIALHVGLVTYGNVGADDRLDFTVIGPAVNEAARIEKLCDELGRSLLASRAFADAAGPAAARLTSLGRHRLRGVREAVELYGLAAG